MSRSATSDLGLHCLTISNKNNTRLIRVKICPDKLISVVPRVQHCRIPDILPPMSLKMRQARA